jgi:hypothetical protein
MADTPWKLDGNVGVDPDRDFLGTTNGQPVVFRTGGTERMRIDPGGNVGIGSTQTAGRFFVTSGDNFTNPQVAITQTTLFDFARLRFISFGADPDRPGVAVAFPLWDIAAGRNVLNFFAQGRGNVVTMAADGSVGIGTERPQSRLHVEGTATVGILEISGGGDLSESFLTAGEEAPLEPGSVVVIDEERPGQLRLSATPQDPKVAGIVCGAGGLRPGVRLGGGAPEGGPRATVALAGCVYCKAETESGAIRPGDRLTSSRVPGHAMKAGRDAPSGTILGKAMEPLLTGTGLILVLVTLL